MIDAPRELVDVRLLVDRGGLRPLQWTVIMGWKLGVSRLGSISAQWWAA